MHRHALPVLAAALALGLVGSAQAADDSVLIETASATLWAPSVSGAATTSLFLETASGRDLDGVVACVDGDGLADIVPMHQALDKGIGAGITMDQIAAFVTTEHVALFRPDIDDEVVLDASCWLEGSAGRVTLPSRLLAFDLDTDESVMAASLLDPGLSSEALGLFSLVRGDDGTTLRLQVFDGEDQRSLELDLASVELGSDAVVLRSWTQDGKAYVAMVGEDALSIGELSWSRDNGSVVVSAFSQYGSHISVTAPGVNVVSAFSNYGSAQEVAPPGIAQSWTSEDGALYLDLQDDEGTTWLQVEGTQIIDSGYALGHEDLNE